LQLSVDLQRQGIQLNIVTYNTLISTCGKGKDLPKALQLCGVLQRQGSKPDTVTYNAVISGCDKGTHFHIAHEVFKAMQRKGAVPVVIPIYPLALASSAFGRAERAVSL